jgi:hypothetical protein
VDNLGGALLPGATTWPGTLLVEPLAGALLKLELLVHQKLVPQANELLKLLNALLKPGGMFVNHAGSGDGCGVGPGLGMGELVTVWPIVSGLAMNIATRIIDRTVHFIYPTLSWYQNKEHSSCQKTINGT